MTQREIIATILITLAAVVGAMAAPLMADASTKVIIGTGMGSFASTIIALLVVLGLDPRSAFGGGGNG